MTTILHVTDMQGDFGATDGVLFVPGGDTVATAINTFMEELPAGVIDQTVFTYDTHPWFSYFSSDECLPFPAIHCEQGQKGWELVVDPSKMAGKSEIVYAPKETFDYWGGKATNNITVKHNAGPNSALGHAFFQRKMQEDGYKFLPRDATIAEFSAATGHDFTGGQYQGAITVLPYDASKGKGLEGYYIRKNEGATEIVALADSTLVKVYDNIGTAASDKDCLAPLYERSTTIPQDLSDTKVIMVGLATNFCVFDAMLGYLARGAKVFAVEDLMAGIPNGAEGQKFLLDATGVDRTATGDLGDVMRTKHFRKYVDNGQLVKVSAKDFLGFAKALKTAPKPVSRFPKP